MRPESCRPLCFRICSLTSWPLRNASLSLQRLPLERLFWPITGGFPSPQSCRRSGRRRPGLCAASSTARAPARRRRPAGTAAPSTATHPPTRHVGISMPRGSRGPCRGRQTRQCSRRPPLKRCESGELSSRVGLQHLIQEIEDLRHGIVLRRHHAIEVLLAVGREIEDATTEGQLVPHETAHKGNCFRRPRQRLHRHAGHPQHVLKGFLVELLVGVALEDREEDRGEKPTIPG